MGDTSVDFQTVKVFVTTLEQKLQESIMRNFVIRRSIEMMNMMTLIIEKSSCEFNNINLPTTLLKAEKMKLFYFHGFLKYAMFLVNQNESQEKLYENCLEELSNEILKSVNTEK